jgi:hypothetical protein
LGSRVYGLQLRVQGSRLSVERFGSELQGLGFRVRVGVHLLHVLQVTSSSHRMYRLHSSRKSTPATTCQLIVFYYYQSLLLPGLMGSTFSMRACAVMDSGVPRRRFDGGGGGAL